MPSRAVEVDSLGPADATALAQMSQARTDHKPGLARPGAYVDRFALLLVGDAGGVLDVTGRHAPGEPAPKVGDRAPGHSGQSLLPRRNWR